MVPDRSRGRVGVGRGFFHPAQIPHGNRPEVAARSGPQPVNPRTRMTGRISQRSREAEHATLARDGQRSQSWSAMRPQYGCDW